ncbi:hypothetical protein ES703_106725 [subsurface metagenome]
MELAQEPDALLLGRGLFAKTLPHRIPDLLDRVLPVHETDDLVGSRRESLESPGGMILENIPQLTTIVMAMNLRMTPQTRFQTRYPVPGRTI